MTEGSLWVGLKDDGSNTNFRWLDGTPLTDNNIWYPTDPNNAAHLCGMLYSAQDSLWDTSCDEIYSFICEVDVGK